MTDNTTGTAPTFWAAPDIAKAGYKVFPVEGKAPSVAGGFYAATTDPSQIAAWIEDGHGDHDIAVATGIVSDVVVVDADSPETYAEMEERYGPPTVKTKRGGHWWCRHPRKGKVSSTSIREHLDRKGDGGYVVVPPSRGRSWTEGIPEKNTLPVLPREFRGEDKTSTNGIHAEPVEVEGVLRGVPEGERDLTLFRTSAKLRGAGVPYAFARRLILEAAASCDPPFPEEQAIAKVDSAYSRYQPNSELVRGDRKPPTPGVSVLYGSRNNQNREWPTMEEEAYRGMFGRIVRLAEEHTEGDPVALLAGAMTAFGSAVGRGPHMQIGATKHHTNVFIGIVGDTSKGRKGSTWDPVENVMHVADRRWTENRIQSGLSSGEGLIAEVRDRIEVPDKDGKMKVADPGVSDKRLLVMEGELSQVLKVIKRDGNTLSPVLRNAWDGKTLKTMVKHSPLKATEPHVSILGHITRDELVRHLTETEMANGFANRYLWLLVRRSKRLPFGGEWHTVNLQPISREIVGALEYANRTVRMRWAEDAKPLWAEAYETLTEDRPGMFGAVTARAEAQTLRLAMLYALADCSDELRQTHIESALAVWEYAEESACYIFGDAIGDPDADKVLETLKECEDGLTRTEVRDLFGRNRSGEDLDRILKAPGRVRVTRHREGGSKKPVERWHAA